MNLTVCIITKNESKKLKKCLMKLKEFPFETVVADTGSTDGTKAMLSRLQNDMPQLKVCDFRWTDDFSEARNYSVSQASNDMVMILDSDEYLQSVDMEMLERLIEDNPRAVGRIRLDNVVSGNGEKTVSREHLNRLFNRKIYKYSGRIHEQIVRIDTGECPQHTYLIPVTALHDGYAGSDEEKRKKAYRNIELLLREVRLNPEDPYLLYQIGKSYYMAGEYKSAAGYLGNVLDFDLNPKLEYVVDAVESYGYALINSGRADKALMFENIREEFGDRADFHVLMGFIYMNNRMYKKAIDEFLEATGYDDMHTGTEGANSYIALYNAAVVYECLGYEEDAMKLYKQCGKYKPAVKRIKAIREKKKSV